MLLVRIAIPMMFSNTLYQWYTVNPQTLHTDKFVRYYSKSLVSVLL